MRRVFNHLLPVHEIIPLVLIRFFRHMDVIYILNLRGGTNLIVIWAFRIQCRIATRTVF